MIADVLLTPAEVARRLRKRKETVLAMIHGGQLPALNLPGPSGKPRFKVRPADVEAALTPRSRLLILNNPCNPTGAVYTAAELEALLETAAAADLFVVCDEVYCDLRHERAPFVSFAAQGADARGRSVAAAAHATWMIPLRVLEADPADHAGWRAGALEAVSSLLAG